MLTPWLQLCLFINHSTYFACWAGFSINTCIVLLCLLQAFFALPRAKKYTLPIGNHLSQMVCYRKPTEEVLQHKNAAKLLNKALNTHTLGDNICFHWYVTHYNAKSFCNQAYSTLFSSLLNFLFHTEVQSTSSIPVYTVYWQIFIVKNFGRNLSWQKLITLNIFFWVFTLLITLVLHMCTCAK